MLSFKLPLKLHETLWYQHILKGNSYVLYSDLVIRWFRFIQDVTCKTVLNIYTNTTSIRQVPYITV